MREFTFTAYGRGDVSLWTWRGMLDSNDVESINQWFATLANDCREMYGDRIKFLHLTRV